MQLAASLGPDQGVLVVSASGFVACDGYERRFMSRGPGAACRVTLAGGRQVAAALSQFPCGRSRVIWDGRAWSLGVDGARGCPAPCERRYAARLTSWLGRRQSFERASARRAWRTAGGWRHDGPMLGRYTKALASEIAMEEFSAKRWAV